MKRILALTAVAGLAATLAACGGNAADDYSKTSAKKISTDATAAMKKLKSFHVKGSIVESGQTSALDLSMATSGACVGTITLKGQKVAIISTGSKAYLKGSADFWNQQAGSGAGAVMGDKWITGFPADTAKEFCPIDEIFSDDMTKDLSAGKVSGTTTVGGTPAVNVATKDSDGTPITIAVAATSPHRVLSAKGKSGESMTFDKFDQAVKATAPSGAVDISSLGG